MEYIWAAKSGTLVFTQQIAGIWLGCFSTILWYLVNVYITIEHGPVEILDLPIQNGDFQ